MSNIKKLSQHLSQLWYKINASAAMQLVTAVISTPRKRSVVPH